LITQARRKWCGEVSPAMNYYRISRKMGIERGYKESLLREDGTEQ